MENQDPVTPDNQDPGEVESTETESSELESSGSDVSASWKSGLRTDLRDSALLKKFDDSPDGLNKAIESHANLEKLLGHEKVPIPKGENDVEGWNRFSKALGIPDKAEGYGLPDMKAPDGSVVDKNQFAEIVHAHKLTPAQAKGLWKTYNELNNQAYQSSVESQQKQITDTVNRLKGEWGDAYQINVELGQMVINKFSDDAETNDWITATLSKDPRGIKFLAKIGDQFAENKVGEFQIKRFTLAPEQAGEEWRRITQDPSHPYNNEKSSPREREEAINYVNRLIATAKGIKG